MEMGSEKNGWGQSFWWGLHLIPPAYLRWDDWKIRVYEPYDNQLKFLNEARDWQSWYFAFRGVLEIPEGDRTAYLKYILFRLLNKENQEKFKIWEWRYGITKIDPEPGEKCIYRDDFLNFVKEQMVIRYHELMSEPPERDYEDDQRIIDARNQLRGKVADALFLNKTWEKVGIKHFDIDDYKILDLYVRFKRGVDVDLGRFKAFLKEHVLCEFNILSMDDYDLQSCKDIDPNFDFRFNDVRIKNGRS